MAIFQSGNPTLSEKIFNRSIDQTNADTMTVRGSINKFGFLLLMVAAAASYTWKLYYDFKVETMMTLFWIGMIGGLITAIVISVRPTLAKYLAPAYGLLEGLFIGGISAIVNDSVKGKYPNIVLQAVLLTFGVAFAVFLLYNFRIIRPTQKFKAVLMSAIFGIFIFYIIYIIISLFGVHLQFMSWHDASPLGIGINLFVVAIAALSLILDFERIEVGQDMGAPKYMEWYGAFGLLVTMVWLYLEILKLLSRFGSSRS